MTDDLDRETRNRLVAKHVLEQLDEDPEFHGRYVLHCQEGGIVHVTSEETTPASEIVSGSDP